MGSPLIFDEREGKAGWPEPSKTSLTKITKSSKRRKRPWSPMALPPANPVRPMIPSWQSCPEASRCSHRQSQDARAGPVPGNQKTTPVRNVPHHASLFSRDSATDPRRQSRRRRTALPHQAIPARFLNPGHPLKQYRLHSLFPSVIPVFPPLSFPTFLIGNPGVFCSRGVRINGGAEENDPGWILDC